MEETSKHFILDMGREYSCSFKYLNSNIILNFLIPLPNTHGLTPRILATGSRHISDQQDTVRT